MVDLSQIIDKFPPIIPRESDSIISRYIESIQEETDDFGDDLKDIRESRFIDKATGDDLDRIGRMYGPLGKRAGRDDSEYRKYLKSLVPVFQYRGTVPGIKEAVAAGLDIESGINGESAAPAELSVYEHFNDDPANLEEYLEYTITLKEWPEHQASTIEDLAELSDASVSRLRKVRYEIEKERAGSSDNIRVTEGQQVSDESISDDFVAVDDNTTAVDDEGSSDDAVTVFEDTAGNMVWGSENWNFAEWS